VNKEPITTSKRLIYNTLFNVITQISYAVISFFLIRFFLGKLGEAKYGVWVIVGSIFVYRDTLSMGLNSAINRYIPVYLAENNKEGIQKVISTSRIFFLALSLVLVVASLIIHNNIGSWFALDKTLAIVAAQLVLIVGFCFAIAMPLQLSSAVLSGLQRYDIVNIATLIPLIIRTVLLVVLLSLGCGLLAMGLIFGLSEVSMRIIQFIFVRKLLPDVSFSLRSMDFKLLREMLGYGINTLLYSVAAIIICKASDIVIGVFMSTSDVARFSVVISSVMLLSQIQAITTAIKPAVSDLDARNDIMRVREIAFLTQKYTLLLLIPAVCFFVVMGKEFLNVWVGDKFSSSAIIDELSVVLAILAIGHGLRLAQDSNFMVLVGKGDHKIFGTLAVLTAVLCVILSILSTKVFKLGLIGIAWANFIPLTITSVFILPFYFNRKMQIPHGESLRQVWLPALLGGFPSVLTIVVWKYLLPPGSWLELGLVVAVVAVILFVGSWFLSFKTIERQRFLRIIRWPVS
jgi:O-antigen/teichoic acid export membrane protein